MSNRGWTDMMCVVQVIGFVFFTSTVLFFSRAGLAGAYEDIKKCGGKIFSQHELATISSQGSLLRAFIEDTLLSPGAECPVLTIRCWWTSTEIYEQMHKSPLSLSLSVFAYDLKKWIPLSGRLDGFQCNGRPQAVGVRGLEMSLPGHYLFGITPIELVVQESAAAKELYRSVSFASFPASTRDKPKAVVFDLDQTLTYPEPGDKSKPVYRPFAPMVNEVRDLVKDGYTIFYVTARSGSSREVSRNWLLQQDLPPGPLFMREEVPNLAGKSSEERDQILGEGTLASKIAAIATIQKQFDITAAYGDAWSDIEIYQWANIPGIVHVNWHDEDADAPEICSDYRIVSSRSYDSFGHGSVTIDRYVYRPQDDNSVGKKQPGHEHRAQPQVSKVGLSGNAFFGPSEMQPWSRTLMKPASTPVIGRCVVSSYSEPVACVGADSFSLKLRAGEGGKPGESEGRAGILSLGEHK